MTRIHKPIIQRITEVLQEDSRVLAAWLEGSIARGEDDDLSDIDLWIAVKDRNFNTFVEEREQFAAQLGPVLSVLYPKTPDQPEDIESFKILLEDHPTSLSIDVDVQKESRKFSFTKDSDAEECKVLFDKGSIIKYQPFNPQEVEEYARELFEDTVLRFWHCIPKVAVLLQRNDLVEAVHQYYDRLEELVTILRILYVPEKADWGFKDIEYDLPDDALSTIYSLIPRAHEKSLQKTLNKCVKVCAKQTKIVGKRLHVDIPRDLIKTVMQEI